MKSVFEIIQRLDYRGCLHTLNEGWGTYLLSRAT